MADGVDEVAGLFTQEIAPKEPPRDRRGNLVETPARPERMFGGREIEGDDAGDTRDGGDNEAYRAREREIADGDEAGTRGKPAKESKDLRRTPADAENDQSPDDEQVDQGELQPVDEEEPVDEGEKFEVIVDGKPQEVTLAEALRGYVRQETFHQRAAQINQANQEIENNAAQLRQGWAELQKARADYEEDLGSLIPAEPNWDQEFAANPQNAHATMKIFQALYGKLTQSRQVRAQREAAETAETDRRIQKYAVEGFTKFVTTHIKWMPDEATLKKEVQSMRRTAADAGFSEYETATVYDPRMLTVLWWASRFRRMTAAQPKPVIPGKGRSMAPGAATPLGNVRRKGFDDAQRKLAQSGRLEDAAEVFRRML